MMMHQGMFLLDFENETFIGEFIGVPRLGGQNSRIRNILQQKDDWVKKECYVDHGFLLPLQFSFALLFGTLIHTTQYNFAASVRWL